MIVLFLEREFFFRIAHCLALLLLKKGRKFDTVTSNCLFFFEMLISHFNARVWNFRIKQTVPACYRSFERSLWCERKTDDLKSVVVRIVKEIANHSSCVVFITDSTYRGLLDGRAIKMFSFLSRYYVSILQ